MIRAIVADDETPAREELIYILGRLGNIEVVGQASHGLEVLSLNKKLKPDLIFLDIKIPGLNGIDIANKILEENHVPHIVFVTAYEEYALEAFEVNAIDYILKPVSEERLKKGINKIVEHMNLERRYYYDRLNRLLKGLKGKENDHVNRISVYHNGRLIPLNFEDIIYATVEGKNTIIISTKGKFQVSYTLRELENKLTLPCFFRSHKSFIINLDMIESIEPWFNSTYNVILKNVNVKIPVSRSQSKEFKELMNIC